MLKGAIIGFGEVAQHGHWPAYESSSDAQIVAVVDRTAERRALATLLSPGLAAFETVAELRASRSIDFVDICTPPALHPEPMLEAIASGWHVLCEKPFLLDPDVLQTVRQRAIDKCVAVVPVHNWKFAPIIQRATAALRSGAIGRLTRVEVEVSRLRAAPTAEAGGPNWRRDPAIAGGGILMDHGWHAMYLVLHWFGERATAVHASLHRPPNGFVEDEAAVRVTFPSGEASIALTWNGTVRRNEIRLSGTGGSILIGDDTLQITRGATDEADVPGREAGVRDRASEITTFPLALSSGSHHADWFTAMLPEVIHCFRDPSRARPLVDEAAECLSIIQQAYKSSLSLA